VRKSLAGVARRWRQIEKKNLCASCFFAAGARMRVVTRTTANLISCLSRNCVLQAETEIVAIQQLAIAEQTSGTAAKQLCFAADEGSNHFSLWSTTNINA